MVEIVKPVLSSVILDEAQEMRRVPAEPNRKRPDWFWDRFDTTTLFYDCFAHHGSDEVLLVGPSPINLEEAYDSAKFYSADKELDFERFGTRVTHVTKLKNVDQNAASITAKISGQQFDIPISDSYADLFADKNVLIGLNKNNDLQWIRDWANYYVRVHGANAIIVFENGSDRYDLDAVAETLAQVEGLDAVAIVDVPFKFGSLDPAFFSYPERHKFMQPCLLEIALRRFCARANGFMQIDFDELLQPLDGENIFERARSSADGVLYFAGKWMSSCVKEGAPNQRHRDFKFLDRPIVRDICPTKYVLAPQHEKMRNLNIIPQVHRVWDIAADKRMKKQIVSTFWHFKGINSNWKLSRRVLKPPHRWLNPIDQTWVQLANNLWPK